MRASAPPLVMTDVVEHAGTRRGSPATRTSSVMRAVDLEVAGERVARAPGSSSSVVTAVRKPSAAEVDAEDRHRTLAQAPRDAQQRAVTAQNDDQVGARDHVAELEPGADSRARSANPGSASAVTSRCCNHRTSSRPSSHGMGAAALDHDADVYARTDPITAFARRRPSSLALVQPFRCSA